MGMDINPAGRNQHPGGVDLAPSGPRFAADRRDQARVDRYVADKSRLPGIYL